MSRIAHGVRWRRTLENWMTVAAGMGLIALASACAQWLVAPHRDLGVVTIALAGASVVLAAPFTAPEAAVLGAVALVAALGWRRAARHGVGRPGLVGVGLLVAVGASGAMVWMPELIGVSAERVGAVGLGLCLLTATLGFTLALERPGPRRRRPHWYRTVPIERR